MEKEIVEGNKLIAEFMGVRPYFPFGMIESGAEYPSYHSKWNLLMPVVEKIANIRYPEYYGKGKNKPDDIPMYYDYAYPRTFGMRDENGLFMVRFNASTLHSSERLIEACWLAVVDFIKWYNSNK